MPRPAKAMVAVGCARALAEHKGEVNNGELQAMRDAGFSEADISGRSDRESALSSTSGIAPP